jgi:hypothetical protein
MEKLAHKVKKMLNIFVKTISHRGDNMFKLIDDIIQKFRTCFNRESTFYWFCVIVFGMIVRSDFRGVTSIIGGLS